MHTRRRFLAACAAAAAVAVPVLQAQAGPPLRVAILGATSAQAYASRWAAFRAGLAGLGYVEGRTLVVDERYADGRHDRLPALARELVARQPHVIVTHGIPGTRAAQAASTSIPIVMAIVTDPVAAGLVQSFAHPGGNVTGTAWFAPELAAKRLGLLREFDPRLRRVAVLANPDNPAFNRSVLATMEAMARSAGVELVIVEARDPAGFGAAITSAVAARAGALAVLEEAALNGAPADIALHARRHRLPSVGNREYAEAGGLIGYGVDLHDLFRRAAGFVDRLARGESASRLPVEQATQFDLVLNDRTAAAIEVTLPPAMRLRAARVVG